MASVVTVKTEKRPSPDPEDGDTVAKKARYENNRCWCLALLPAHSQGSSCLLTRSDERHLSKTCTS